MPRSRAASLALALTSGLLACTPSEAPEPGQTSTSASSCPSSPRFDAQVPDVTPAMASAEFWLAKYEPELRDAALVGAAEREALAARLAATAGAWRDPIDPALADPTHVQTELDERLAWLRERVATGKYVEGEPEALERAALILAAATPVGEAEALRPIVEETPLWCVPTQAGLYTPPPAGGAIDRDFDRNLCASLHLGELVRVLRSTSEWAYVDAGHSVGWIATSGAAPLGLARTREAVLAERAQPHGYVLDDWAVPELAGVQLRAGTRFVLREGALVVPTAGGEQRVAFADGDPVSVGALPPTRRRVFEQAFLRLDEAYGWGGRAGQRDCSSLMLDVFAQFDIRLGRNSAVQSQLGVETIELRDRSEADKRVAMRSAAQRGVVLLYMPGHIMLYLGHHELAGVDHDYAISAISEFLVPCPGGPDTVHRIDRVALTTLELGRGSERRAYIERIERLAVFGPLE